MGISDYLLTDGENAKRRGAAIDAYNAGGIAAAAGKVANTSMKDGFMGAAGMAKKYLLDPPAQFLKTAVTGDPTPIGSQPTMVSPAQAKSPVPVRFVPSEAAPNPDASGPMQGNNPYLKVINSRGPGGPMRSISYDSGRSTEEIAADPTVQGSRAQRFAEAQARAADPRFDPNYIAAQNREIEAKYRKTETGIPGVKPEDGTFTTKFANNAARRDYRDAQQADVARVGSAAQYLNAVTGSKVGDAQIEAAKANAKTSGVKAYSEALDNKTKEKISVLQDQFLQEKDPKKKEAIQLQMLALMGKDTTADKFQQIQTMVGVDPITQQPIYKAGLVNTRTGEFLEPKTAAATENKFVEGKVYKDANGNQATYKNGKFEPVK